MSCSLHSSLPLMAPLPAQQAFLKSQKLAVGGKKADLEARLRQHLGLTAAQ